MPQEVHFWWYMCNPGGRLRVSVRSEAYREVSLSSEFRLEDTVVPVTLVIVLPSPSMSAIGLMVRVFSVKSVYHRVSCDLRWYLYCSDIRQWSCPVRRQPVFCSVCRSPGHLPRACPLCGLCQCCEKPRSCGSGVWTGLGSASSPASDPVVPDVSSE